jgi:hypothetical protein
LFGFFVSEFYVFWIDGLFRIQNRERGPPSLTSFKASSKYARGFKPLIFNVAWIDHTI